MHRMNAPLVLFFALIACKGGGGTDVPPGAGFKEVEIPKEWESNEASVVMRLTNTSTASTETKRALNQIFNDAVEPIDGIDFLMRRPEKDEAGAYLPVDTSLSQGELLAGSSIEQLEAYKQKLVDGDRVPFGRDEAVDTCGNEMIMAIASPHIMQEVFTDGPQDLDIWPTSCPDGVDCETASQGTWDVGMSEMRFDGMVDMVVNVFPDLNQSPAKPALWGHFEGFFLTANNPGTPWVSLFLNARRIQVNLLSLWQLDRTYVDPMGVREVFKFPHRARTLNQSDVFVFFEGYDKAEDYWNATGLGDSVVPYGASEGSAVLIDQTSVIGSALAQQAGTDPLILTTLTDIFTYQVGAAVACPTVRESKYVRQGPVEFFLCPDIEIGTCMATEDMEEGACVYEVEPEFDPFNPLSLPVAFPRVEITTPSEVGVITENQLPTYLSVPVQPFVASVELTVTADSVLYMYDPDVIGATITNTATGLPVTLPTAVGDSHCTESTVQRFDIGAEWGAGSYAFDLDYSLSTSVVEETDLIGGSTYLQWIYLTSVPTWTSSPG